MFVMTVADACEVLGLSKTRVLQLIKNGVLDAEKVGNAWLIDERSVQARKSVDVRAGRPPKHEPIKAPRYMLMNREHEVLAFRFDSSTGEFFDAEEIVDAARAPLSVMSPRGKRASKAALSEWWAHRAIPKNRTGIEAKLLQLGVSETYDLPFRSLGLSLSDQYWVRPYDADIEWGDINFYENSFLEAEVQDWLADVGLDSPDNTSDGMLPKRWIEDGPHRVLLKGGSALGQEPYNEVIATELFSRLLDEEDFVPYELREWGNALASACPGFVGPTEEFIPAHYVMSGLKAPAHLDEFQGYIHRCASLGVEGIERALSKMILCDFILANTDRHWRNFGVMRDVETLEYRVAPLFDSGTSLWCQVPARELGYASFSYDAKPFYEDAKRQLRLVGDISWFDIDRLAGFPEWTADLLDQDPSMQGRVDFIFEGIQKNIDHVRAVFI